MTIADDTARTLDTVRAYHRAWTNQRFADAAERLAPDLKVEVPVNRYTNATEFAAALSAFGGLVERVELLSELARGDEAMLLYDMTVQGLGALRVAEHFTVTGGKITRLRQIHDTAAIRAAGFVNEA